MKSQETRWLEDQESYWGRLSDEELLKIEFTTDDPESLPGLIDDVPDIKTRPMVEMAYNFRGTKRAYIRCAHCKYPNHREGFVIKVDDCTRFLCGHDCGKKIYGIDFETFRGEFHAAKSRKLSLLRMQNLKARLPDFNAYLLKLRTSSGMVGFKETKDHFRKAMPRLHGALEAVTRRSNLQLLLDRQIRDTAAENRADARYDKDLEAYNNTSPKDRVERRLKPPKRPEKPIFTTEPYVVGSIPSPTLFTELCFRKPDFDALASQFAALEQAQLVGTLRTGTFKYQGKRDGGGLNRAIRTSIVGEGIEKVLKDANTLLDRLDEMLGRYEELGRFFDRSVLGSVADWATKNDNIPGEYRLVGSGLGCVREDGEEVFASLPAGYEIPDRAPLRALKEAINRA